MALHERTLPLGQPAVAALVRQAVFHLGELTDCEAPELAWRAGWEAEDDVLPTLHRELAALADELRDTPREHEQVVLLGEVRGCRRFAGQQAARELHGSGLQRPASSRPLSACMLLHHALW